ncbi:hypothetical protein U1Q18_018430 [Sarracenia purpurea var. burkii]
MCQGETRRSSERNLSGDCRGSMRTFAPLTGTIALLGSRDMRRLPPGSLNQPLGFSIPTDLTIRSRVGLAAGMVEVGGSTELMDVLAGSVLNLEG